MAKARLASLNKKLNPPEKKDTSSVMKKKVTEKIEANVPRGERSNFHKLTITMSHEMLSAIRSIGLKRKSEGKKDTDTSSLIREALSSFISANQ